MSEETAKNLDRVAVLIVDDSAFARAGAIVCLKSVGLTDAWFSQASNGEQALAHLKENHCDLLVTDLNMPKLSGDELIKEIRGDDKWQDMAIVVASSQGDGQRAQMLKELGANAAIAKPLTGQATLQTLRELFQVKGWVGGES